VVDADGVYRKTGPARVFTREIDAIAAIKGHAVGRISNPADLKRGAESARGRIGNPSDSDVRPIKPGDIIVLMGRGPMGSGMEEIYQITSALKHLSWGREVALITDARFSGVSTGACIGHVGPEALAGGPIGKVLDGDLIRITIDRNALTGSVDFVGTPGSIGDACGVVTASARNRPAWTYGKAVKTVGVAISTSPEIIAVIIGPAPL